MNILISIISNRPDRVQRFIDNNRIHINSSKHNISLLVNFNNIEELPNLNTYHINNTVRIVDPLIDSDGNYHWNTTRLSDTLGNFDFDYLHLIDDDVLFKCNLDNLYDNLDINNHKFVQVTSDRLSNIDEEFDTFIKGKRVVSKPTTFKKVDEITLATKFTAGGHLLSHDFLSDNINRLMLFDVFNEDTWRCYVALELGSCYITNRRLAVSEYDSRQYKSDERMKSLIRFTELGVPVWINNFNSITPLVKLPDGNCSKVGDLVYSGVNSTSSLFKKYARYIRKEIVYIEKN